MLTTPSQYPDDPALGPVIEALAPQRFAGALRALDPQAGAWSHCRALEALYDPGDHVRVAYGLSSEPLEVRRMWPQGEVCYVRYPVRAPMSRRGQVLNVDGLDVEVYRFPNDRRLRGLRKFSRRDRAAAAWQQWLKDLEPEVRLQPDTLRRSLLRYVPEQKWIIRLQGRCDGPSEQDGKRAVAVRSADVRDCRTVYQRNRVLRRAIRELPVGFHIPRALMLDERLGLLVTRWAYGDALLDLLRDSDPREILPRVAEGLHGFQGLSIPDLPVRSAADCLNSARDAVQDLGTALPTHRQALEFILESLSRRRPAPDDAGACTVHNDFHCGQLRGDGDRLTVLDFERCVRGDGCMDVANFVYQIMMLPHRSDVQVSEEQARSWIRAFMEGWERHGVVDAERLRWFGSVALLTLARGMMRHLRDGWPTLVERCLDLATRQLSTREPEFAP